MLRKRRAARRKSLWGKLTEGISERRWRRGRSSGEEGFQRTLVTPPVDTITGRKAVQQLGTQLSAQQPREDNHLGFKVDAASGRGGISCCYGRY